MRLDDVFPKFAFPTKETMGDYCLETWYIRVASRDPNDLKLKILGIEEILGKSLNFTEW